MKNGIKLLKVRVGSQRQFVTVERAYGSVFRVIAERNGKKLATLLHASELKAIAEIFSAILVAVLMVATPVSACETAPVKVEWHDASWVQGGYEDRETIVTSQSAPVDHMDDRAAAEWNMAQLRAEAAEPPTPTPGILIRGNQRVTAAEVNYVPIPDYSYTPAPKARAPLSGPSMGIRPTKQIKSYSGTRRETWSFLPPQVRFE